MKIKLLLALASAGLSLLSAPRAATITEDFTRDPFQDGWRVFGDTNLFQWDSTNHVLDVTWDSSRPNSYFYHPLGMSMGRSNDFSMAFDLFLTDYAVGFPPNYYQFELAAGFLNYGEAAGPGFLRGSFDTYPDLVEFDYFPADDLGDSDYLLTTFFDSEYDYGDIESSAATTPLPTNVVIRVSMNYTANNQTSVLTLTTNGVALFAPLPVTLANPPDFDNFRVDTFAVESYNGADSGGSILAHGAIGNVLLVVPPPLNIVQVTLDDGVAGVQIASQTGWNYVLQSSADLQTWRPVGPGVVGTGGLLMLRDPNPIQQQQFYQVNAQPGD
jgi:hypothetical protein